ncbi:MAG TPA: hemin uptake protein HemP [Dongiaceae bacterium]|jgi:hemin uptake protein HemP|nr:hemin uptake protein HemP [Dongiaceae bacterium]
MEAMTSGRLPPGRADAGRARPAERRLDSGPRGSGPPGDSVRRVPLSKILGEDREVVIEFNGADYHLRITRNEKLILTK